MTTIHEYHNDPEYTSHSRLRDLRSRGARYYHDRHVARTLAPDPPSKAMILGQALEDLIQRPADFPATYAVRPEGLDGRTKEGKAWAEQHAGKNIIAASDGDTLSTMAARVEDLLDRQRPGWRQWRQQATLRAELRGVKVQARPDWLDAEGIDYNLKSCESLDDLTGGRSIANFGYHTQAHLVASCLSCSLDAPPREARLVAVERQAPHRAVLVKLSPAWWPSAQTWLAQSLDLLRECQTTGQWPLVWSESLDVEPPSWM